MLKNNNYDSIENIIEDIWDELEPKIVGSICKEFKLDCNVTNMKLDDLHKKLGNNLGFCHIVWDSQKKILKKDYNIIWYSPTDMNPDINFD